ncbi:N-acyl homoserine lactonase family protein [Ruminococcaceae bacterium OttesenSCG-928-O06]|nr:N-acyl homoserine lactonase family protein [Ruminococcaceae bacterium OttesenSCG-928-O06]
MNHWTITALDYGTITVPKGNLAAGLDPDLILDFPYMGYLLQNGRQNVLVDTGIHEDNIVDGMAWGGCPAKGGSRYVLQALEKEGLAPKDIDTVLYTHLHNDHAGCALLFPEAKTYFQKDELANLLNPLPTQKIRSDFDKRTPGDLEQLKDIYMVDGDLVLPNGLELYKLPGHTLGSMAIIVPTQKGRYILTGDIPHLFISLFPKTDKMELLGGEVIDITPAPDNMMPYLFNSVIYDHYAAFDSFNKLKALAESFEPEWYLTGHDMWVLNRRKFG